jgi:hypothetical protein
MKEAWDGYAQVAAMQALVAADTAATLPPAVVTAAKAFDSTLAAVAGSPDGGRGFFGFGGPRPAPTFVGVNGNLANQLNALENGDMAPTVAMQAAYVSACNDLKSVVTAWTAVSGVRLAVLNAALAQNGVKPTPAPTPTVPSPACALR